MSFAAYNFTAANGTALQAYSSWTQNTSFAGSAGISGGVVYGNGGTSALYCAPDTPPSADYEVSATLYPRDTDTTSNAGLVARFTTSGYSGYMARYRRGTGVQLFRYAGTNSAIQLGTTAAGDKAVGTPFTFALRCIGSTISVVVDGTVVISVTDTNVTAANRAGIWQSGNGAGTGVEIDDWSASALPVLSSPTGTAASSSTATGTVSTDTGNGTLYWVATTNATETAATVKAGSSQAVSATGSQSVSVSSLAAATSYRIHYIQTSSGGDDSAVVSSSPFTTSAGAATATTLSGPSGGSVGLASTNFTVGANGAITGTVTVTPSDGGAGGTFSPTSVAISSGTPTATFTYTASSAGAKTISISDTGSLTDAAALTYTASTTSGTVVVSGIKNGSGTLLTAVTLPNVVVIRRMDRALLLALTDQVTSGSGELAISSGAIPPGAACMVVAFSADGSAAGAWPATAA